MDRFLYKRSAGVTALSASMTEFKYKKHAHREYAIGVTLRGIQHYNLEGRLQLSYQNGIMLFNPEQTHDGMAHDKTGLDYVMLYIGPQLLFEAADRKSNIQFSTPIVYDYGLEQRILSLTQAILLEKDEALCYELLVSLADRLVQNNLLADSKKDHVLVARAKEMINANLEEVLKLDDIGGELQLSKFQFIRLFKAHTGISPYQYYLNSKIALAKQLIDKNRDVYSAVAECGFVDLAHLNKHFKSIYGATAHEYLSHITGH